MNMIKEKIAQNAVETRLIASLHPPLLLAPFRFQRKGYVQAFPTISLETKTTFSPRRRRENIASSFETRRSGGGAEISDNLCHSWQKTKDI